MVALLLPIFVIIFSAASPTTFLSLSNFQAILTTNAVLLILAVGQTIVLSTGEFDFSFGGVLGLDAAIVVAAMNGLHWSNGEAILLSLVVSVLIGMVNAFFVVAVNVSSFIVTLGMGTLTEGIGLWLTGSQTITNPSSTVTTAMGDKLGGIGLPFFYSLLLFIVLWFVFQYTRTGRHMHFVGEGRYAAFLAGIRVNRIRVGALIASSLLAWLAGMTMLGQTAAVDATYGESFLLPVFAAVFLGYTTIHVGRFNAVGTLVGALVLAVGTTGLELLSVPSWVTDVFSGGILIGAVALANIFGSERNAARV